MTQTDIKQTSGQFIRFAVVGLVSTAVNYGVFWLLKEFTGINPVICSGIGFMAGVAVGFSLNKSWTFKAKDTTIVDTIKYYGIYLVTLFVDMAAIYVMTTQLGWNDNLSKFFAIGITTVLNFAGTKFLVFKA